MREPGLTADTALRRTKVVATLGPATGAEEVIRQLVDAGLDAARLNFSHGTRAEHGERIELLRRVAREVGRPVPIIQDLQGAKVRLGRLAGGSLALLPGQAVSLIPEPGDEAEPGSASSDPSVARLPVTLATLAEQVPAGSTILLDDGRVRLRALDSSDGELRAEVETGGILRERAGVNLPGIRLQVEPLTRKDREDLAFGTERQVEFVAMSFVRSAGDLRELRAELAELSSKARIIAKIEKWEAIADLEAIIEEADAVMVARGDLGVELPPEEVPLLQKRIIREALEQGKAAITATQMLESMTNSPVFTRAEASDVANAVLDGTAALMLSAETSIGRFPVEAVQAMDRIARRVEGDLPVLPGGGGVPARFPAASSSTPAAASTRAVGRAACRLAEELGAVAIITPTQSGATARQVSRFRPAMPILAVTPDPLVLRQLSLEWGVIPLPGSACADTEATIREAVRTARAHGFVGDGDLAVVTAGAPGRPGTTNLIRLVRVGAEEE